MSKSPLMTAQEVAAYLRIKPNSLYLMLRRGDGPPALRVGRQFRFRRHEIERFLREGVRKTERQS